MFQKLLIHIFELAHQILFFLAELAQGELFCLVGRYIFESVFSGRNFNGPFVPERIIGLVLTLINRFFNSSDAGFRGHDLVDVFNKTLNLSICLVKCMICIFVELLE
jgi:hypothetical protein